MSVSITVLLSHARECILLKCLASVLLILYSTNSTDAFTYMLAGEGDDLNAVVHPIGYDGSGGHLTISVGIDPNFSFAAAMEPATLRAIETWNGLQPTVNNILSDGATDVPVWQFDFESTLLHELGHALGLAHPNLGNLAANPNEESKYTMSTDGANNVFEVFPGPDGVVGSADDMRGDDINLNWFRIDNNNPFTLATVVDSTTYSRDWADLPVGDWYSTNSNRMVAETVFGLLNTEAVMQQGQPSGEAQRTLGHDDVAGIRYAMAGLDELAGTADDYTFTLDYVGMTDTADILIDMSLASGFAGTGIGAYGLGSGHWAINGAHLSFNSNVDWYFSQIPVVVATWIGADGYWTDASHWDTDPEYPNNNGSQYNAIINVGNVTLNQSVTINQLSLGTAGDSDAELAIISGILATNDAYVAAQSGSLATVSVSGNTSEWNIVSFLSIGDYGNGTLQIENGGRVAAHDMDVGSQSGSAGNATVTGTNSELQVFHDLDIGDQGEGAFTVRNGGIFRADGTTRLGRETTGQGTLVIDGPGSAMEHSGSLQIGEAGTGTVLVTNEGQVEIDHRITVGNQASANGNLTVSGENALVNERDFCVVGNFGSGRLDIEHGARMVVDAEASWASWMLIAQQQNSHGEVHVSDEGSSLTVENSVVVGGNDGAAGGSALLRVESGGSVSVGNRLKIWDHGRVESLGGMLDVDKLQVLNGSCLLSGGTIVASTIEQQGTFEFNSGTLHVTTHEGDLDNMGGILAPGEAIGTTHITGGYTQHQDAASEIEIGGDLPSDEYDVITIDGTASLAGYLTILLVDEFAPSNGDTFDVLTASSIIDNGLMLAGDDWGFNFEMISGTILRLTYTGLQILAADFDDNGSVDSGDLAIWREGFSMTATASHVDGDADLDGDVDGNDFLIWQREFGLTAGSGVAAASVPEPGTIVMLLTAIIAGFGLRTPITRNSACQLL